ncbi:MAG: FIST N-terminal domain-containing protein [Arcobacteraceae bacterium]|nr:FIST N-terminal domain-containing protein [Arcobacteraceae bacterium]
MIKKSYIYEDGKWDAVIDGSLDSQNTLVICFGSTNFDDIKDGFEEITNNFKNSIIIGCSTSGEIHNDLLYTSSLSVMVMKFEATTLMLSTVHIDNVDNSFVIGKK